MKYRVFGRTGWEVSEVGLGTWQLGGDWGEVDRDSARTIMKTAVEQGVNFFDTADVYGNGKSETLIGEFLAGCGEKVCVATKLGRLEGFPDGYSSELFRRCVDNSLRRLRRESIDLVQLHCIPEKWLRSGEVFGFLRELLKEGKIRAFGASVETLEEADICLGQPDLASLQIIFNIFRQEPADALFDRAVRNGTALIVRLPLASGLLGGRYTSSTTFAPSDHRSYNRDGEAFSVGETFSGLEFSRGLECVDAVRELLPEGISMASFALRWILDHPEVTVVIPGATKASQVKSNAGASELPPPLRGGASIIGAYVPGTVQGTHTGPQVACACLFGMSPTILITDFAFQVPGIPVKNRSGPATVIPLPVFIEQHRHARRSCRLRWGTVEQATVPK